MSQRPPRFRQSFFNPSTWSMPEKVVANLPRKRSYQAIDHWALYSFGQIQTVCYWTFKFGKGKWFLLLATKEWLKVHIQGGLPCANVWSSGNPHISLYSHSHTCALHSQGTRVTIDGTQRLCFRRCWVLVSLCLCSSILYCIGELGKCPQSH